MPCIDKASLYHDLNSHRPHSQNGIRAVFSFAVVWPFIIIIPIPFVLVLAGIQEAAQKFEFSKER